MGRFTGVLAVLAVLAASGGAWGQTVETEIQALLARRQALADSGAVNLRDMSAAIRAAVTDAERLERIGDYPAALERLRGLETFGALPDLPSLDVQMLASWLYAKLSEPAAAALHRGRADAMRQVLTRHVGGGGSPDDPLKLVVESELGEWVRANLVRIGDLKRLPQPGSDRIVVTYAGPTTYFQPRTLYAELAAQRPAPEVENLFTPQPLTEGDGKFLTALHDAKARRQRFLDDSGFDYLALAASLDAAMGEAVALDQAGEAEEALARLRQLETIRPLDDIPTPELIAQYSALCGKVGNVEKQARLRELLFGINQAIAHSGDGASAETAVQVILVSEEYTWLREKRLTPGRQRLLKLPSGTFDVISTRDAAGVERDYYFNVTPLFARYGDSLKAKN